MVVKLKIAWSQINNSKEEMSLYQTHLIDDSAGKQRGSFLTMGVEI